MHRLRFKERIVSVDGEIFVDGEKLDSDVHRFLGTIGSLGPETPVEFTDIIVSAFDNTKIKAKVQEYLTVEFNKWTVVGREYGYDSIWFAKRLKESGW
jgi:hypothetical protein